MKMLIARYGGKGVLKAVANVNERIAPKLIGLDALFERYGFQIGFLGAYITHSTFAYESIQLVESGEWKSFFLYLAGTASIGLLSCGIGYFIGGAH